MVDRVSKLLEFLKTSPGDSFIQHALALEYIKIGDDVAARKMFQNNLQYNPGYVATYYHLGKLLERAGDQQLAINIYAQGMAASKTAGDMHTYSELQAAHDELAY